MSDQLSDEELVALDAQTDPAPDRSGFLIDALVERKLPQREYLLGHILSTTSRWIINGDTGIGKSILTFDIAAAIAAGSGLMHWGGSGKRKRVMLFDGEMPAETFQERIKLLQTVYGRGLQFYGYNRDLMAQEGEELHPFNTPEGQLWLWREINATTPDLIVFDSIMCLTSGELSGEEAWLPVKPLVRQLTSHRIAQIWLHHTGHDKTHGFGTKTREWEMDTTIILNLPADGSEGIEVRFTKARLRQEYTDPEFADVTIVRRKTGWEKVGSANQRPGKASDERTHVRRWFLETYDRLADDVKPVRGLDATSMVKKVNIGAIRDAMKSRGHLDVDENTGSITVQSRNHFRRAKADLMAANTIIEQDELVWRIADKTPRK